MKCFMMLESCRSPVRIAMQDIMASVQAQECGEQFQLQDDIQYALDGLCSSALPSDRADSAAKLAQMAVTRRGRLAFR